MLSDNAAKAVSKQRVGKKKALIIAVSEYHKKSGLRPLPFCSNDGEAVYDVLKTQGYDIPDNFKLVGKVEGTRIKHAIIDFFSDAGAADTLIFYFSGHGIPDGYGDHFLASSDIDREKPQKYGYPFYELEKERDRSLSKRTVTILDCCFSGAAGTTIGKGDSDDIAKAASVEINDTFKEGYGKCLIASSLGGQYSYKMKNRDFSIFTYYLTEGLKGGEGECVTSSGHVTASKLGAYLYNMVTSKGRQQPISKTATSGDIVLAYHPLLKQKQSVDNQGILENAMRKFGSGKYDEALESIDSVLKTTPNNITAWDMKGNILYKEKKDYERALVCYNEILKIEPNDEEANKMKNKLLALSEASRKRSAQNPDDPIHKEGIAILELLANMSEPEKLIEKGHEFEDVGKYYDAITFYDKAIGIRPDFAEAHFSKGVALSGLGEYNEAIAAYDKATGIRPDFAEAHDNKGNSLSILAMYNEAIAAYDKAIGIRPDYAETYYNKGMALRGLREFEQEIKCYEEAIRIRPDFAEAHFSKGVALGKRCKPEQEIKCYEEAIRIRPDFAEAHFNMGIVLHNQGKYNEAIAAYDKAIGIRPDYAAAWSGKGVALGIQDKYNEAIAACNTAIGIKPDYADAWYNKGLALKKTGRKQEAEECFKKAEELG